MEAEYIFALTNPGSEKALKLEVETMGLGWRLSYQRKGFVTFKSDRSFSISSLDVALGCARRLCVSLGKFRSAEEAVRRIREESNSSKPLLIQYAKYFERRMQGISGDLRKPDLGEMVGTVVELGEGEFWAGIHRHQLGLSPDPAGDGGLTMDERSPSRAWLKLEEAIRFFELQFTSRDIVVEVGCAPGGVVLALLDRGVSVIGVDPAKMADVVMESSIADRNDPPRDRPWFYHCRKPAALVSKRDLGMDVTWFMSDMNQSPDVVLKECARFCKMSPRIKGVLITLKLTDLQQISEKEHWFAALNGMGFKSIRLQQLSVHHKEFALLATLVTSN